MKKLTLILVLFVIFLSACSLNKYNKGESPDIISEKCAIQGGSATWEKIVDSVPVFKKFQQDLNLVTTSIDCECYKPSCYSCRIKNVGSEFVYYLDGYFIIGEKKYLVKNNKVEMHDLENSFKTSDHFDDRVDNVMKDMYSNERISVIKELCFKDRIKNVLFDIYLTLGKFNDAHESGNSDYPKSDFKINLIYNESINSGSSGDVYFYNNQFFVRIKGGEASWVYNYSIDGEHIGIYCEDTWSQLNDNSSNPSCDIPVGAIRASDLIKTLDKSCSDACK